MKYPRILGVATIVATASIVLLGLGTASATRLCNNNANTITCSSHVAKGSTIELGLENNTVSFETLETPPVTFETCTGSTILGSTATTGSATETVEMSVAKTGLTWTNCVRNTTTIAGGTLQLHWNKGTDNASVTAKGFEITFNLPLGDCIYGFEPNVFESLGELKGGNPATLTINAVLKKRNTCMDPDTTIRWTGAYTVGKPNPLYVTEG